MFEIGDQVIVKGDYHGWIDLLYQVGGVPHARVIIDILSDEYIYAPETDLVLHERKKNV